STRAFAAPGRNRVIDVNTAAGEEHPTFEYARRTATSRNTGKLADCNRRDATSNRSTTRTQSTSDRAVRSNVNKRAIAASSSDTTPTTGESMTTPSDMQAPQPQKHTRTTTTRKDSSSKEFLYV
ncbi:hypothetical protein BFL43_11845, partial [Williamsia sp. 1135]